MRREQKNIKVRFNLNWTRNGRCLKIWVSRDNEKFAPLNIMIDGLTNEDDLRRAVETQLMFSAEKIVEFFKDDLDGVADEVLAVRQKERDRIAQVRASAKSAKQEPVWMRMAPEGECVLCDRARATDDQMMPNHSASPRCESGSHNHCTCDRCY